MNSSLRNKFNQKHLVAHNRVKMSMNFWKLYASTANKIWGLTNWQSLFCKGPIRLLKLILQCSHYLLIARSRRKSPLALAPNLQSPPGASSCRHCLLPWRPQLPQSRVLMQPSWAAHSLCPRSHLHVFTTFWCLNRLYCFRVLSRSCEQMPAEAGTAGKGRGQWILSWDGNGWVCHQLFIQNN